MYCVVRARLRVSAFVTPRLYIFLRLHTVDLRLRTRFLPVLLLLPLLCLHVCVYVTRTFCVVRSFLLCLTPVLLFTHVVTVLPRYVCVCVTFTCTFCRSVFYARLHSCDFIFY